MVNMTGQVGYWPYANAYRREMRGLAIYFDDGMMDWAAALPVVDRVCFDVTTTRKLIIKPCANGIPITPGARGARRACSSQAIKADGLKLAIELPLFQLYDVQFKEDGKNLVGQLLSDHELPWPSAHTLRAADDPAAMAKEAVETRLLSLVASGLSNFGNNAVPGHIRSYVPPAVFAEARRTALAINGV